MAELTPLEVLQRARELISDPDNWIKGGFAARLVEKRRFFGLIKPKYEPSSTSDPQADCFCLDGAIQRASMADGPVQMRWLGGAGAARSLLRVPVGGWVVDSPSEELIYRFNDAATHKQVLEVLDDAIARAS